MWMSLCLVHFSHGKIVAERKVLLKWKAVSHAITEVVRIISNDQQYLNVHQSSFHKPVLSSRSLDAAKVNGSFRCFHLAGLQHGNSTSLVSLLWLHCSLPQRHLQRCTAPTEQQVEAGWSKIHPIEVVLRIPKQGLFFLPCYLQAAWRLESTGHSTSSLSRIGLAVTAPSSSLLAPCLCVSDRSSDPDRIFITLFAHTRALEAALPQA